MLFLVYFANFQSIGLSYWFWPKHFPDFDKFDNLAQAQKMDKATII